MIWRVAPYLFSFSVVSVVLAATLWDHRFAWRDVSHFYLPLYDYVAYRTAGEWIPMWNPLDQAGMPLIGESSTAVLYPIRWLVYRLVGDPASALNAYLSFHVLLACWTSGTLASRIGCSPIGTALASTVYPLSGAVFSLCCNPPFLVGAAWLPLAMVAFVAGGRRSMASRICVGSLALSMMVLGGDPQTAFHACLVAATTMIVLGLRAAVRRGKDFEEPWAIAKVLAASAVLAAGISSIQIAASLDWSRQSDRVANDGNRDERYDFSLAPWHALEAFTPRPFGELYPINSRVSTLIPGDGRMWTPSIYAGVAVALAWLLSGFHRRDRWWWYSTIALLASLGHFGVVWLLQQVPGILAEQDSAIGGVYWLICKAIPSYEVFRYPTKWLPVFALGAAMVAGKWASLPRSGPERWWTSAIAIGSTLSLLAMLAAWRSSDALDPTYTDEYWGAMNLSRGYTIAAMSWGWTLVALGALAMVRMPRRKTFVRGHAGPVALLMVVAIDAGAHATTLLPRVHLVEERAIIETWPPPPAANRTLRTQDGAWPKQWKSTHSPGRVIEVSLSERGSWFGRWHLADRAAVFNSMTSIRSRSIDRFWQLVPGRTRGMNRAERHQFWTAVRDWLAIDGVVHVDGNASETKADGLLLAKVTRRNNLSVSPVRAHVHWQARTDLNEVLETLASSGEPLVPRVEMAIEPPRTETPPIVRRLPVGESPDRVSYEVSSGGGCLVERCQFQDGHWTAQLTGIQLGEVRAAKVLPCSELNQAVWIPAGKWRVEFQYRPRWKWPCLVVSLLSAVIWLAMCFRGCRPRANLAVSHSVAGDNV